MMPGQGPQNQQVANILLAGYTADPLRTLFESLIGELVKPNDNEKKIIKNILSRIQKLTENRNDVVHSTWYIGWGNEQTQDFSDAPSLRLHKNKQGAAVKAFNYKSEDFSAFVEEAEKLSYLVRLLKACVTFKRSIEINFKINDVTKLLVDVGAACSDYKFKTMRNLPCKILEFDEIWSFCGMKQKNVPEEKQGVFGYGDVYTWTAICADTKLVPSFLVGKHDAGWAHAFMMDLASR